MHTLPANGQAQPLPAKWVIKRTPENAEMVNKWANEKDRTTQYNEKGGYIHSESISESRPLLLYGRAADGFTLITDAQFRAMVEGEASQSINDLKWFLEGACEKLMAAKEWDLVDQLKAKHPDIWPVDYAAIVLEKAEKWAAACTGSIFTAVELELLKSVRNYLTNQK